MSATDNIRDSARYRVVRTIMHETEDGMVPVGKGVYRGYVLHPPASKDPSERRFRLEATEGSFKWTMPFATLTHYLQTGAITLEDQ